MRTIFLTMGVLSLLLLTATSCDDDDGSEADRRGVGAQCADADDCTEEGQQCLDQFKGGYCGVEACTGDVDCPDGSACIAHTDGVKYCFLVCIDKVECNRHRDVVNESNCVGSGTVTFVDDDMGRKVCVPPSGT